MLPGENLFLIADRSVLWVDLAVFEADARSVRRGIPVKVTVDVLPGHTYQGTVTFITLRSTKRLVRSLARAEIATGMARSARACS